MLQRWPDLNDKKEDTRKVKGFFIKRRYSKNKRRSRHSKTLNGDQSPSQIDDQYKTNLMRSMERSRVLKLGNAAKRIKEILNKEINRKGLTSRSRTSPSRKENVHVSLIQWIGGHKRNKTYHRSGRPMNGDRKEKNTVSGDGSFKKATRHKKNIVFSKILGFQRRSKSYNVGRRPNILETNHLMKQKTETNRVSLSLQEYQQKQENQKTNNKQLKDFLYSISSQIKVKRLKYLSESYSDLNKLGAGKTATVRKIQRKSDSKYFIGKFIDLENLISNGFFRRLKVISSNSNYGFI